MEAVTRAENVEALSSWSACRIERDVEDAGLELGRLAVEESVEEVRRVGEVGAGPQLGKARPPPVELAEDRRQHRREALGPADRARAGPGLVRLEQGELADGRPEDVHRRRGHGHRVDPLGHRGRELPKLDQAVAQGRELIGGRKAAVPEQVGGLLEGRLRDEVADVVAVVDQSALLPVDEADVRFQGDDVLEAPLDLLRIVRHRPWTGRARRTPP